MSRRLPLISGDAAAERVTVLPRDERTPVDRPTVAIVSVLDDAEFVRTLRARLGPSVDVVSGAALPATRVPTLLVAVTDGRPPSRLPESLRALLPDAALVLSEARPGVAAGLAEVFAARFASKGA